MSSINRILRNRAAERAAAEFARAAGYAGLYHPYAAALSWPAAAAAAHHLWSPLGPSNPTAPPLGSANPCHGIPILGPAQTHSTISSDLSHPGSHSTSSTRPPSSGSPAIRPHHRKKKIKIKGN